MRNRKHIQSRVFRLLVASVVGGLGTLTVGCSGRFPADSAAIAEAAARYDAPRLAAGLDAIIGWHENNRTGVAERLNPGATEVEIQARFGELGLEPTDELKLIWGRHNGQRGSQPLIWYHDLLSVEGAISEYSDLVRNPVIRWDPRFIPVFQFQGEWYATLCAPEAAQAGPVIHFDLTEGAQVAYANMTTLFATMERALAERAVIWDDQRGGMVEDIRALAAIHRDFNPNARFPYFVDPGDPIPKSTK